MKIVYAILVFLLLFSGAYHAGKSAGFDEGKSKLSDKKDEATAEGQADVKEVIIYRDKEKVVYRDKVKNIYVKADPTGCRVTKLIDMGISLQ